jgi:hypothetical protein
MTPGRFVTYRLDTCDVTGINSRRDNFAWHQGRSTHKHPHQHGTRGATGHQAHIGTPVHEGQPFPALVVAENGSRLNLQVFLDGNDVQWVAGVPEGTGPGTWS